MNRVKQIIKSPFVRNVTVLATGTAAAQGIAFLLAPIITRLYGPEAYGLMGTFNSFISIIGPIAALTYPIAIVLPKNDYNAKGLIKLSLIITTIIASISLILLLLFNKRIIDIFNLNEIGDFLYLIPIVVIFAGLLQVSEQWLIRTKQFSINARVTFFHSAIINGGKAGIGLFYPNAAVLVVLTALGNGLKAAMMFLFVRKSSYKSKIPNDKESNYQVKELAKKHIAFPFFRAPETFLNAVSQSLPILMLTAFFGPISAGFYTLARTIMGVPGQLIGKSVGDVFYPRIAEAANKKEKLTPTLTKATISLGLVGIVPYGVIILFGPSLFGFIFGDEWSVAGEYARWLALWNFFGFMNRPSVQTLPVLNLLKFHLVYTIIMLVTRIILLAIGYYVFVSDIIAIKLFGISGAILNIGLILITIKFSKRFDQKYNKTM